MFWRVCCLILFGIGGVIASANNFSEANQEAKPVQVCAERDGYIYWRNQIKEPLTNISQFAFTFAVDRAKRKPLGSAISVLSNKNRNLFFYSNLKNLSGKTITHRWIYEGKNGNQERVMANVSFDVGGARWRIWSSKNLWHSWVGKWRVDVINQLEPENVYGRFYFEYLSSADFQTLCASLNS